MASETLSGWIRRQMRLKGWTQADLARALTESSGGTVVSSGRVSEWVNEKRTPEPRSCDRLADVFGADLDMVLALAGHRPTMRFRKADDPGEVIAAMVRRIDWTKPGRLNPIRVQLQLFLDEDREKRGKG